MKLKTSPRYPVKQITAVCLSAAFCWVTHRSSDCQHLETQTLTGASQSCTHTHTHTYTHTHIPEGARWGWKQEVVKFTPARVRTVIYPHQGQLQQMWQDKMKKERREVEEEDNIHSSVTSIVSPREMASLTHCHLFASWRN